MKPFHTLLNTYREQRGLSSTALANGAGLSPSYVSLLLRGKKASPSAQTVRALAGALDLTQEELEELAASSGHNVLDFKEGHTSTRSDVDPGMDPHMVGITAVRSELSLNVLEAYILNTQKSIRIQDSWLVDPERYRRMFFAVFQKRQEVCIEILLLDPESAFAKQRSVDLHAREEGFVSERIKDAFHEFNLLREAGVKITMAYYNSLPSVQQIACDQHRFIGFFTHGERSDLSPQLEIEGENSLLGGFFEHEFR